MWPINLSVRLRIVALVGHYPTNKLIGRGLILHRRSFQPPPMQAGVVSGIRPRFHLGLAGGPARFTRDFSGPVLLGRFLSKPLMFRLRGSYPLRRTFRMSFDYINGF